MSDVRTVNDKMQAPRGASHMPPMMGGGLWCFNVTCVDMASGVGGDGAGYFSSVYYHLLCRLGAVGLCV